MQDGQRATCLASRQVKKGPDLDGSLWRGCNTHACVLARILSISLSQCPVGCPCILVATVAVMGDSVQRWVFVPGGPARWDWSPGLPFPWEEERTSSSSILFSVLS